MHVPASNSRRLRHICLCRRPGRVQRPGPARASRLTVYELHPTHYEPNAPGMSVHCAGPGRPRPAPPGGGGGAPLLAPGPPAGPRRAGAPRRGAECKKKSASGRNGDGFLRTGRAERRGGLPPRPRPRPPRCTNEDVPMYEAERAGPGIPSVRGREPGALGAAAPRRVGGAFARAVTFWPG